MRSERKRLDNHLLFALTRELEDKNSTEILHINRELWEECSLLKQQPNQTKQNEKMETKLVKTRNHNDVKLI